MENPDKVNDALEYIEGQLEDGYIDLGFHDELELQIVKEAIKLYKSKNGFGGESNK